MVGSNITQKMSSTAFVESLASMAIDMQRAAEIVSKLLGREIQLRIGISTGPVVAGIIGSQNRVYDIYGSTVNLASRMETTCLPSKIQVCQHTGDFLKKTSKFVLEERGRVLLKGIGELNTFLLCSSESQTPYHMNLQSAKQSLQNPISKPGKM